MSKSRLLTLWLALLVGLVAITLYPVNSRVLRLSFLLLLLAVWGGLLLLVWKHRLPRYALIAITTLIGVFLILPAKTPPTAEELRDEYVAALRRYDGVPYVWGGENWRGIDCSGLIRRAMMDVLTSRGIRSADPGALRLAISLWWNDTTASVFGEPGSPLTSPVQETRRINEMDHSKLLPGDLAVTVSNAHIMAYLGDGTWIEADPEANRVITVATPAPGISWFEAPMRIVRWRLLTSGDGI